MSSHKPRSYIMFTVASHSIRSSTLAAGRLPAQAGRQLNVIFDGIKGKPCGQAGDREQYFQPECVCWGGGGGGVVCTNCRGAVGVCRYRWSTSRAGLEKFSSTHTHREILLHTMLLYNMRTCIRGLRHFSQAK